MQNKDKDKDKELETGPLIDLTFCFEAMMIIEEALNKLNFIGTYTYSNSANAMSKSIGQQIDRLMRHQQELEKRFEELIIEKTSKIDLVDQQKIIELTKKIQICAKDLKDSTNNICKSLAENPDIVVNLDKAKGDKELIKINLETIKQDLINGNFNDFNNIIDKIKRNNINIEELRKKEMSLFERLRKLNEDLAKEEQEYIKDSKHLNNKLVIAKKELAKTKMEMNIMRDYRKSYLDALKNLKETNFRDSEEQLLKEIASKTQEKENEISIGNQFQTFLRQQKVKIEEDKVKMDNIKTEKETTNISDKDAKKKEKEIIEEKIKKCEKE